MQKAWSTRTRAALDGPPLFDNCTNRYLDLGTNVGDNIAALYLDQVLPGTLPLRGARRFFSGTDRAHICTLGFEPNQKHRSTLQRLQSRLVRKKLHVQILNAAISSENGMARFWSDGAWQQSVFRNLALSKPN